MTRKRSNIKLWDNIAYIWINGYLDTLSEPYRDLYSPMSKKKKVKYIFKNLLADFLRLFKKTNIPKGKVWFLALTKNNYDALEETYRQTPNSVLVSFFRFRSTINNETYYYTLRLKFFYCFIYPFLWSKYYILHKKKAIRFYDLFYAVNGTYEESLRLLKKTSPKAIVFSNDHLIIARALLLAANDLGIKTYYIQHASVSEYFPPLEFTHSLLEGQDALDKYKLCGAVESFIHLVGMPKFDQYSDYINTNKSVKKIGVAFNLNDNLQSVYNFVSELKNRSINIVIRPHPGDDRDLSIFSGFEISNSKEEGSFDFLIKIDAIIAGDSSIHLEAVHVNVYPVYFIFQRATDSRFDYYKFVKNGLVEYCKTIEEVLFMLDKLKKEKPFVQSRANYYNATLGQKSQINSTELIVKIIEATINSEISE